MKFKLDENLPTELADDLRALGHHAETVSDEGLTGAVDPVLLERIRLESLAFLTMDKGIADVRVYPPQHYAGLVLFRPKSSGRGTVATFVRSNLPNILALDLTGRLLIVSEAGIRIR
jgi:predicted nuclease of predicted toxin-antitoxin system